MTDTAAAAIARLSRWQEFGGVWRVVTEDPTTVTIALCRCDGGEEVDQLTSDAPQLLEWLAGQTSSGDAPDQEFH